MSRWHGRNSWTCEAWRGYGFQGPHCSFWIALQEMAAAQFRNTLRSDIRALQAGDRAWAGTTTTGTSSYGRAESDHCTEIQRLLSIFSCTTWQIGGFWFLFRSVNYSISMPRLYMEFSDWIGRIWCDITACILGNIFTVYQLSRIASFYSLYSELLSLSLQVLLLLIMVMYIIRTDTVVSCFPFLLKLAFPITCPQSQPSRPLVNAQSSIPIEILWFMFCFSRLPC